MRHLKDIEGYAGMVHSTHMTDENDNPAGGVSQGIGFSITWQNGPVGTWAEGGVSRMEHLSKM